MDLIPAIEYLLAQVARHGATVKHAGLMAVYSKPRVSWDTAKLEGYALAHPEITAARTTGKPTISIREAL